MEQFCYHQAEISGALEKCTAPHLCPHTCAKLPISPVCVPMPRPYPISLRSESLGIGFRQLVFLRLPRWLQGTANFKHHWFRIFACLLPYLYAPDFFKLFFFSVGGLLLYSVCWFLLYNNTNQSYDPEIPLLGIYPEKTIIWKDMCTSMFITALFTVARTRKQPRCPQTDEWIKSCGTMKYYSAIKS